MKRAILFVVFFLLLAEPISMSNTRNSSIGIFLDSARTSPEGFANTAGGEANIQSTTFALTLSRLVDHEVNSTLDILLYYQRSQNSDGGFGLNPISNSTWDDTISAVQGLLELNLNDTQLSQWEISNYLNVTANQLFYTHSIVNNQTVITNNDLTLDLIIKWREYIISSILIGVIPPIPNVFLGSVLKSFQLANGSYSTFNLAVHSIKLLDLIAQQPNDVDLSSKFIRAYATTDGLFSSSLNGPPNLESTFHALEALDKLGRLQDLDQKREIILKILDQQKSESGFSDINSDVVTIEDTWLAINILTILESLDELLRPDVLQTQGFVSVDFVIVIGNILLISLLLRRKVQ